MQNTKQHLILPLFLTHRTHALTVMRKTQITFFYIKFLSIIFDKDNSCDLILKTKTNSTSYIIINITLKLKFYLLIQFSYFYFFVDFFNSSDHCVNFDDLNQFFFVIFNDRLCISSFAVIYIHRLTFNLDHNLKKKTMIIDFLSI